MATRPRPRTKIEFLRALVEAGYTDVLMLKKETAESVLTEKRPACSNGFKRETSSP